ncbi:MAG: hypothetical protein QOJ51_5119 [Acidobacteriaceae bacterium]|jgi:hypothetical protein|nr:hypothetical protein [Acidobacteriaceae bacterium]MEA3008268.1 hypothetical protein [Acidobacteriaceae bacterium]
MGSGSGIGPRYAFGLPLNAILHPSGGMAFSSSDDILRLLRTTLQNLEHGLDPIEDAHAMAELKRMILLRIAELEMGDSATSSDSPPLPKDDAA